MTLADADKANKKFEARNPVPKNEEDALMRQAAGAMSSRNFETAIHLYEKLAEQYPAKKGLYLSQVGAGYYFTGDMEKAIELYLLARDNGADSRMMDDNLWEACETLYKSTGDIAALNRYLEYCPEGQYVKKAQKILNEK